MRPALGEGENVASFRADDIMCLVTGDQKKTCLKTLLTKLEQSVGSSLACVQGKFCSAPGHQDVNQRPFWGCGQGHLTSCSTPELSVVCNQAFYYLIIREPNGSFPVMCDWRLQVFCFVLSWKVTCVSCVCVLAILVGVGACGEATGFHILTLLRLD